MTLHLLRRVTHVVRRASVVVPLLVGAAFAVCLGVAGAAPLGQIVEFSSPGSDPAQIQAGSDGNLWFSDRNGAVGRITPDGTITKFTSGLNPGSAVRSIAMGADGNMWFSDPGTTRAIGTINPTTQAISEFSTGLNAGSMPLGIAAGPDGNVWFTDNGTTKAIGVINPTTHAITEFSSGLNPGAALQQGLVAGPDGNLWFTDGGTTPAIGMINPTTHAITEFSAGLNPASRPGASIVVGPDGNLWFMNGGTIPSIGMINPTTHAITEFSTGLSAASALGRLAAAPDGNIWFGNKGATPAIGKINPTTHAITEFSGGLNAGSLPGGMGTGSDGNAWFTDQGVTKAIGRMGWRPGRIGHRSVGGRVGRSQDPPRLRRRRLVDVGRPAAFPQRLRLRRLPVAARRQRDRRCGGEHLRTHPRRRGPPALVSGQPSRTSLRRDASGPSAVPTTVSATSAAVPCARARPNSWTTSPPRSRESAPARACAKVRAIQGYVAADDTANACTTLNALINEVQAQKTRKRISTALAESLIARAHDIQAALGCSEAIVR